jgi:hypothetical protein
MQVTSNQFGTNAGNPGASFRPEIINREQRPAVKPQLREAVAPKAKLPEVIDQNDRAKLLAKVAYNGQSPRGSLLDITA